MSRTIVLHLPLPHKLLSPNARPHHMAKARAKKRDRSTASILALAACPDRPRWPSATIELTYTFKQGRRRDPDNLIAWPKSYIDGIRDSGILADDDKLTFKPPVILKGTPGLQITIVGGES